MNKERDTFISKFLSYVLRHHPDDIKIELDAQGWIDIDTLIKNAKLFGDKEFSKEELLFVVENNSKKRFDLNEDMTKIRANQGHSVEIFLDLPNVKPPEFLYHGTATKFLTSIKAEGLKPMQRHDVHLSYDEKTALAVGQRHGKPMILKIKAQEMFEKGFEFKCTKNNVWLTKNVPVEFIVEN